MQAPQRMHLSECQKSGIPSRRLLPLSHQDNVQLPAFSRSSEMGRILSERRPFRTSRQETQKDTHVFHPRNHLLNTDARNMERRHGCSNIGISFVGADHESSRFGDRKIAAGHAGSCRQKPRTSIVTHELGQVVRVVIAGIGTYGASKHISHILRVL